jgi:lipoprotein-releasing system permease protein
MYITFAWRYFKAKKSAKAINIISWVTMLVIAFTTCCQILVLSVFNGFEGLVQSLYSSFYSDLRISPARGKTIELDSNQLTMIRKNGMIRGISMIAEEKALLKHENGQLVITLKGVDENFHQVSGVPAHMVKGSFNTGNSEDPGMVVGLGLQQTAGISLEESAPPQMFTVILPRFSRSDTDPLSMLSEANLSATGVFSIQQEFDNNYAITDIDFVKNMMQLNPHEYSAAEIRLTQTADPEKVKKYLETLPGKNFKIQTRFEQNESLFNSMRMEKWAIFAILTLILIIAAFNMISALTMLVLEKKQDIQILKGMGATKSRIRGIFLSEGLLLGALGCFLGITLATAICLLQLKYKIIPLQGGAFLIDYFPVKIMARDFILVSATALFITIGASWIPSGKAANQPFRLNQ